LINKKSFPATNDDLKAMFYKMDEKYIFS